MKFLSLSLIGLTLIFKMAIAEKITIKNTDLYAKVKETYGKYNLSAKPAFQGGYINFGYWKGINLDNIKLTKSDRILASRQLYQLIFDELHVNEKDTVLEVGCGLGNGCIEILRYCPKEVVGIDLTPEQIQRAKKKHELSLAVSVSFKVANAQATDFPDETFSKIYSIEAAQYFPSMEEFAKESYRILKKGGKLVLTAHFSTNEEGHKELCELIPTVQENIDRMPPIELVRAAFKQVGFKELKYYSIGNEVFKGSDKWFCQVKDIPWGRNIYKAYKSGYMDYYVMVLEKENENSCD